MKERIIITVVATLAAAIVTDVYMTSSLRANMLARRSVKSMKAATLTLNKAK